MVSHSNSRLREIIRLYLQYLRTVVWAIPWAALYALLRVMEWDSPLLLGVPVAGGIATSLLAWEHIGKKSLSSRSVIIQPSSAAMTVTGVTASTVTFHDFFPERTSNSYQGVYDAYTSIVLTSGRLAIPGDVVAWQIYSECHQTSTNTYNQPIGSLPSSIAATDNQFVFASAA